MTSCNLPHQLLVEDGDTDVLPNAATSITDSRVSVYDSGTQQLDARSVACGGSGTQVKKFVIPHDAVVMLNGQRCTLRVNKETGALCAYPVKANATSSTQMPTVPQIGEDRDSNAAQGLLQLSSCTAEGTGECQQASISEQLNASALLNDETLGATMPRFIIPAPGGQMTVRAITQKQVVAASVVASNCGSQSKLSNIGEDDRVALAAEVGERSLLDMKPVLKQYLLNRGDSTQHIFVTSVTPDKKEPVRIGLKTSESDLEKLRCSLCEHQAYYPHQYQEHLRRTHAADVQYCKCCSQVALDDETLLLHYTEVHPRNICEQCGLTSEHAYIIKRHMYRHTSEGCECDLCGKTYKDQYILKMHVKMVHTPADTLHECHACTKKFTRKAHLKRHQRIHSSEKPFKCPHCDYRGCERSDISKHILIHDEPRHLCEVCGKAFRHLKNKELHLKRHKGQRDYKCGICDFYGYTFTDIRKHIERKHSDVKSIICERCSQIFKTEVAMQEHRRQWHQEDGGAGGCCRVQGTLASILPLASSSGGVSLLSAGGLDDDHEDPLENDEDDSDDDDNGMTKATCSHRDKLAFERTTQVVSMMSDVIVEQADVDDDDAMTFTDGSAITGRSNICQSTIHNVEENGVHFVSGISMVESHPIDSAIS